MKLFTNPNKIIKEKFTPFNATLTIKTDNILDFIIFYDSKHNTVNSIVSHSGMKDKELYDYNKSFYSKYKESFSVNDKDYDKLRDKRVDQYLKENKIKIWNSHGFNLGCNFHGFGLDMQFINKNIFYFGDACGIKNEHFATTKYYNFQSIENFKFDIGFESDPKILKEKMKRIGFKDDFFMFHDNEYLVEVCFPSYKNLIYQGYNNLIFLQVNIFRNVPGNKDKILIYSSYINLPLFFYRNYYEYNMAIIESEKENIKVIKASEIENDLHWEDLRGGLLVNHMFNFHISDI